MSTVRLNSRRDLERFLKVLAEESVLSAQSDIENGKSEKSRQNMFVKRIKADIKSLHEEEPETPDTPSGEEKPAEPPPPPPEDEKSQQAQTPPTAPPESEELNPTLDSLIRAIKEIRSGFGSGDSAIEKEISAYFDKLDPAERISLIVMMRSLGNIMRKEDTGSAAREPSQYNVFMTLKSKDSETEKPESQGSKASSAAPAPAGPEDTTAPIKVNEPVTEAYRAKIRDLLRRSR